MDTNTNWINYITAIGTITTPILIGILSFIGWKFRTKLEQKFSIENKLREDRIETYYEILEPFVILLTNDSAWSLDPKNRGKDKSLTAQQIMYSLDYRKIVFKMSLIGTDNVISAYNDLMQYFYSLNNSGVKSTNEDQGIRIMSLLGDLLLEIRRSTGNDTTILDNWQMMEWFLVDARNLRSKSNK